MTRKKCQSNILMFMNMSKTKDFEVIITKDEKNNLG